MARCPPGVICLETTVFFLACAMVLGLGYIAYAQRGYQKIAASPQIENVSVFEESNVGYSVPFPEVSLPVAPQQFSAPLVPPPPQPLFYGASSQISGRGTYQQVGFLTLSLIHI